METLKSILDILWMLLKIGVLLFIVSFVWLLIYGTIKKLKEEYKE